MEIMFIWLYKSRLLKNSPNLWNLHIYIKQNNMNVTLKILKLNKFILIAYISLSDEKSDHFFHAAVVHQ